MFRQSAHYDFQNWLPFYWHGFSQTTRYTYVIEDLSDTEIVWANIQSRIKRNIKKAVERSGLQLEVDPSLAEFLSINAMTFHRQGQQVPYSDDYVRRIDAVCKDNACRRIFLARDASGRAHAAIYIVWDERSAYYLMGGADPEFRDSGAMGFLMWEAIKHSATVTRAFDFEGSMIESIENFFRGFGAVQKPYHRLVKVNSKLLRIILLCKEAAAR